MRSVHARLVWTPAGALPDHTVVLDGDGVIIEVRPARSGDPSALDGLLVPGLINAHTHLELSGVGLVPRGNGFVGWVGRLIDARRGSETDGVAAAKGLAALGTAVVSDVGNTADRAGWLDSAGLAGVVQVEFLTLDAGRLPGVEAALAACGREGDRIRVRPAVHALYSTAPSLVQGAVAHRSASPASLHVAECPEEMAFVRDGDGPFATFLDTLDIDWGWWSAPGGTPVAFLAGAGVLGPGLLAVHGVYTTDADRRALAESGTPLCLCPRSNLHIGGVLPDVPALLEAGVQVCLGTDSVASSPDLDVLGEIPVLAAAFPQVPVEVWLSAATDRGADALGFPHHGRIAPGAAPGLVLLDVDDVADLAVAAPSRRWV